MLLPELSSQVDSEKLDSVAVSNRGALAPKGLHEVQGVREDARLEVAHRA